MTLNKQLDLAARIDYGIKKGIVEALQEHYAAGLPIYVLRDGTVAKVPASDIRIKNIPEPLQKN